MAKANDWVINVREIAAADEKTIGTKYGSPPSIHLSYLIFSSWKSTFSTTLVLVVLGLLWKQWVTIMTKSSPVVHDRRQKTGWRRRIVTKEDLAAEEWRLRQRLGWAPVLGPCLSRIHSPKIFHVYNLQCFSLPFKDLPSKDPQYSSIAITWALESTLARCEMSQFYSGCWKMKNRSKISYPCHSLFSATFPSFLLKVECWRLEDGKNPEVQNFCGLKIRFWETFQKNLQISLTIPKGDKVSLLSESHWNIVAIWWVRRARSRCPSSLIFLKKKIIFSGPWLKKEDWLKKKDRDQRRPGCRRLKARVSSMQGPYHLPSSWKKRGLAIGKEGREYFVSYSLVFTLRF